MTDLTFYDCEATDANVRHGQMTQFGALRTDLDFNVLNEADIKLRRLPWVVPAPQALEVTRMKPADLSGEGRLSEYAASGEIEKFLVPGYGVERMLLTWNGIRFDDEMIRTTLYRNLRSPWFSSGKLTSRIDVMTLARLAYVIDPSSISVPVNAEGKPSFRLEHIAPANGFAINAHDAFGDTLATMHIARLIRDRTPLAWEAALRFGLPSKVESFLREQQKNKEPVFLFQYFGAPEVIPCAVLGTDAKKKWVLADLRRDLPVEASDIAGALFTKESPFPVIRTNTFPIFLDSDTACRINLGIDESAIRQTAKIINAGRIPTEAVKALRDNTFSPLENATSEELIYSGFTSDRDKPAMTRFHRESEWAAKSELAFGDARLVDFAARIVLDAHMNGEASIQSDVVELLKGRCAEALARPFAPADARWTSIARALEEGADDEWRAWAQTAFESPGGHDIDMAPRQMELGF